MRLQTMQGQLPDTGILHRCCKTALKIWHRWYKIQASTQKMNDRAYFHMLVPIWEECRVVEVWFFNEVFSLKGECSPRTCAPPVSILPWTTLTNTHLLNMASMATMKNRTIREYEIFTTKALKNPIQLLMEKNLFFSLIFHFYKMCNNRHQNSYFSHKYSTYLL